MHILNIFHAFLFALSLGVNFNLCFACSLAVLGSSCCLHSCSTYGNHGVYVWRCFPLRYRSISSGTPAHVPAFTVSSIQPSMCIPWTAIFHSQSGRTRAELRAESWESYLAAEAAEVDFHSGARQKARCEGVGKPPAHRTVSLWVRVYSPTMRSETPRTSGGRTV